MNKSRFLLVGIIICLFAVLSPAAAQSPIVITMTAPEYFSDLYQDTIIPAFEAENPDIQVEFVFTEQYYSSPLFEIEEGEYFDSMAEYASSADVLYVTDYIISPYATNAGFFLDLSPLVNTDTSLMPEDFYAAAWQAYQWDGGIWALPYSMTVDVLVYNQDLFDSAGIAYPDETWRLDDFIRAAEALHTFNSAGEVEFSPLQAINPMLLLYAEIGSGMVDTSVIPNVPDYANPQLIPAMETWNTYWNSYEFAEVQGYSFDQVPMSISFPYQIANQSFSSDDTNWGISLLPGGVAGARVEGFGISRGTAYPEAAYEFITFLSRNADLLRYSFNNNAARRSLANAEPEDERFSTGPEFEPEVQAVLDQAMENAVSPSELRFANVFFAARGEDEVDFAAAVEDHRQQVIDALEAAQAQQSRQITVAAPEIRPELAPGEVVLNFGINSFGSFSEERDRWEAMIAEFVAAQPTIADIDLDNNIYGEGGIDETLDCYYDSNSVLVDGVAPPDGLLALDPFFSVDPDFSSGNFLPGVLEKGQFEGVSYGYPLTVQPVMMWINVDKFEEAGLPIPDAGWTINDFTNALITLGNMRDDPETPIVKNDSFGVTSLMMLFAAYGGMPIDYQTDPPTYNLTEPQNLEAMRQVISYIRDENLIAYTRLAGFGGGGGGSFSMEDEYIVIDVLGNWSFRLQNRNMGNTPSPLRPVPFPSGDVILASYMVGMAVINDESLNIQGCYDWLSLVADHPEMLPGMPADLTQLDNPVLAASQGEDVVAFYRQLTDMWSQPNVVVLPDPNGFVPSSTLGAWLEPYFFYTGLDNVILNDADLEAEMTQAEANVAAYRDCTSGIEEISQSELEALSQTNEQAALDYFRQYVDCAVNVLPELQEQFGFFYQ